MYTGNANHESLMSYFNNHHHINTFLVFHPSNPFLNNYTQYQSRFFSTTDTFIIAGIFWGAVSLARVDDDHVFVVFIYLGTWTTYGLVTGMESSTS